jgi:hypothetical protein
VGAWHICMPSSMASRVCLVRCANTFFFHCCCCCCCCLCYRTRSWSAWTCVLWSTQGRWQSSKQMWAPASAKLASEELVKGPNNVICTCYTDSHSSWGLQ